MTTTWWLVGHQIQSGPISSVEPREAHSLSAVPGPDVTQSLCKIKDATFIPLNIQSTSKLWWLGFICFLDSWIKCLFSLSTQFLIGIIPNTADEELPICKGSITIMQRKCIVQKNVTKKTKKERSHLYWFRVPKELFSSLLTPNSGLSAKTWFMNHPWGTGKYSALD